MEGNEKQYMGKLSELAAQMPARSLSRAGMGGGDKVAEIGTVPKVIDAIHGMLEAEGKEIELLTSKLTPILTAEPTSGAEVARPSLVSNSALGQSLIQILNILRSHTDHIRAVRDALEL